MADKVMRLGCGLFVWVWFARHFGPEIFGVWNYAIAFAALFGASATLGMDGVIVRELVSRAADTGAILGTALAMRVAAAVLAAAASVISVAVLRHNAGLPVLLVALNASAFVLQSSQVLDLYFQARMHPRPAVVAVNLAYLVTTAMRLVLLLGDAPIEWFATSLVVEPALAAALLCHAYRADASIAQWRFDGVIARRLLTESWPLLLSGLAVMVYMRIDQVMLSAFVGDHAVGQFSAALRIAEMWYFIPMAVMTAAFPLMMARKAEGSESFERYVQKLYDSMAWFGLMVAATVTLISPSIIALLYGEAFAEAAGILSVQIWAGVAVAMSFVHGKWLLAEGLQRYGLVYTAAGACVNVGLNLLLIPKFGAIGAAWATLATQIGLLPIQLLFPKARRNFLLMLRAATAPYRILQSLRPANP